MCRGPVREDRANDMDVVSAEAMDEADGSSSDTAGMDVVSDGTE